jgi:hypothetical protein
VLGLDDCQAQILDFAANDGGLDVTIKYRVRSSQSPAQLKEKCSPIGVEFARELVDKHGLSG